MYTDQRITYVYIYVYICHFLLFLFNIENIFISQPFVYVSAVFIPDWELTFDSTNDASIVQWGNLTSLLKRPIPFYIIILNRNCGFSMFHEVIRSNRLALKISQPYLEPTCSVEVFGVDEKGQLYSTTKGSYYKPANEWLISIDFYFLSL